MKPFEEKLTQSLQNLKMYGDPNINNSVDNAIKKIQSNETISKKKKKETREATGAASAGQFSAPLFSDFSSKETTSKISGKVPEVREDQEGFKVPKLTMFSDESKEYKLKENKIKGGLSDKKTLEDIAKKHAYNDSTDSTSKEMILKMFNHIKKELDKGIKVEMEHTKNRETAKEIAMDHLYEDPNYYIKLSKVETNEGKNSAKDIFIKDLLNDPEYIEFKKNRMFFDDETRQQRSLGTVNVTSGDPFIQKKKYSRIKESESEKNIDEKWSQKYKDSIDCKNPKGFSQKAHCQGKVKKSETKEATGAGSSGSYSQPSIWAKSTNKKDWAAARKTQIPGGKFVTVKKKCKKFPYCNQGDINAVKLWENDVMKKVISNVSEVTGLNEEKIKSILIQELQNNGKLI